MYQEVKKLLQVRKAHKALSNQGDISFVYAKKDAYPLAYIRSNDEEKVLVVINPSDQNVTFDFDEEGKETIMCTLNCPYSGDNVIWTISGSGTGCQNRDS